MCSRSNLIIRVHFQDKNIDMIWVIMIICVVQAMLMGCYVLIYSAFTLKECERYKHIKSKFIISIFQVPHPLTVNF